MVAYEYQYLHYVYYRRFMCKGVILFPPVIVRESPAASNLIPQLTGRNPAGPIPLLLNERKMLTQKNQQLYIPE